MIEALIDAIGNRAVLEERRKAAFAGIEHGVDSLDIQIRLLLSGEARVGQIFRGGTAAHRH